MDLRDQRKEGNYHVPDLRTAGGKVAALSPINSR
jgi:hypothetical protein